MHQWRLWNAMDGLPLCFIAEKDGCGARQPKFSAKDVRYICRHTSPYSASPLVGLLVVKGHLYRIGGNYD